MREVDFTRDVSAVLRELGPPWPLTRRALAVRMPNGSVEAEVSLENREEYGLMTIPGRVVRRASLDNDVRPFVEAIRRGAELIAEDYARAQEGVAGLRKGETRPVEGDG